jgi:hypothetical protein
MTTRAVANPVGVILILGMTILSVGALLTVGGAVVDDTRADAEHSQMENSMSAFSSKASLVGLGESGHQRFSLGRVSQGRVDVREDAGRVHVKIQRNGTNETVRETSMGAVVYENDGREIAYQGGGVWARQGDFSRMLSPPEFHYRAETLTFPIINVTGDGAASGDIRGTVRSDTEAQQWYPDDSEEDFDNPLTNGTVYVEIESEYCRGWQSFFERRSQGRVEDRCGDNKTVIVDLAVPFILTGDDPVIAQDINPSGNNNDIPESWREDVVAPSPDSEIDAKIEECTDGSCDSLPTSGDISHGKYVASADHTMDGVTFKTGSGDTTVAVDGDLTAGQVDVEGDGNVTLYVRGEFRLSGSGDINSGGDADQFITLVDSDGDVRFNGNSAYTGVIYAPKSTTSFNGNPAIDYKGVLVTDKFDLNGNLDKLDFQPAEELDDYRILGGERPLTYLHISENNVEIQIE